MDLPFHSRQLRAGVHAEGLHWITHHDGTNAPAGVAQRGQQIGEVVLALGVVGRELPEMVEQGIRLENVDAGVDLVDAQLLGGGVLRLDDAQNNASIIADDAAIHRRLVQLHGQECRRVVRSLVLLDQPLQCLGPGQRNVAGENEHPAGAIHIGRGLLHRMAGTELLFLKGELGAITDRPLYCFSLMSDDHHRSAGRDLAGEIEHVVNERPASRSMKDLHRHGLHPCPQTGS